MSKKMTCMSVIASAALLLSPMRSLAQNLFEKATSPSKNQQKVQVDSRLAKRLHFSREKQNSPFRTAKKNVMKKSTRLGGGVLQEGERTFWGDWEYDPLNENHNPGIYALDPEFMNPEQIFSFASSGENLQYGSAYVDGKIYGCSSILIWGIFQTYDRVTIDLATGELTQDYAETADLALETAKDPNTGIVYGEFLDLSGNGYVLATMDYPTWTRTDIAPLQNTYAALGISSQGQLYGVATDGNLYKIDKSNGVETLVGPTGLTLANAEGGYYGMSGDIDPADDTFFFNGINANTVETGLYYIDLETGAATQKGFDVGEVFGLMSVPAAIAEGAPAKAADLAVVFDGASTEGTLTFTVPTTTAAGEELTGDVNYQVLQNGAILAEGTAAAGANVVSTITSNGLGQQYFTVVLSNAAGKSDVASVGAWIGVDMPNLVQNLTVNIDEQNVATVTWEAPEAGIHGGFQDVLTYDVYRVVNHVPALVAENLTETTFSETIEAGDLALYQYAVVAKNSTYNGPMLTSDGKVLGDAFQVPYEAVLTDVDFFTVINSNGDNSTWSPYSDGNWYYNYNMDNAGDDWFITPPIYLEAGKSYSINVNMGTNSSYYTERFEVKLGKDATAEAMTIPVVEPTELATNYAGVDYGTERISVEESGNYYVGIHAISDPDQFYLFLNAISVGFGLVDESPKAAENLTVTADPNGALKATVTFTAPSKNFADEDLEGDLKAQILRDKEVIAEVPYTAGAEVTYVDEPAPHGTHSYQVICYAGEINGQKSNIVSAFIGYDVPVAVNVTKTLNPDANRVHLEWEPATQGVTGGLVDPNETYYLVYSTAVEGNSLTLTDMVDSLYAETQTDFADATEVGDNDMAYWAVMPGNVQAGTGDATLGSMWVGQPMTMPFFDNFAGNTVGGNLYYFRSGNTDSYSSGLAFATESSDGDGSCLNFISTVPQSWLNMSYGKLTAANGALNPVIIFDYKLDNVANNAQVIIDNQNDKKIVTDLVSNGTTEWQTAKFDLKEFANERYIVPYIGANFVEAGNMLIDNIMMIDQLEYNLVASISAPAKVEAGQNSKVTVKVRNLGVNAASNYTVRVFADDVELAIDGAQFTDIASLETRTFTANYREDIFSDAKNVKLKAVVEYDLDLDPDDNVAETMVEVKTASTNGPENVSASVKDNGVHVAWSVPEVKITEMTENFEDQEVFEPFSVGGITETNHYGKLGDWSLYDGNGIETYSWQGVSYPNQYQPQAFQVLNVDALGEQFSANYSAASGSQFLISFCPAGDGVYPPADHWLISPMLSGSEQTISFSARAITDQYGAETYEVLASSGSTAPSDFTVVQSFSTTDVEWTNVEVTVPAGTKYFAIRHTSQDIFGLMLDDAKFVTMGGVNLKGYKVYVDRILVAGLAQDINGYVYDEFLTNGAHEIAVSGVLDNGLETKPVTVVVNVNNAPTAIESIIAKGEPFDVFTVDGVAVRRNVTNVNGLKAGVYVVNGQKVVIK